jgi:hypothetical protein
VLLVGDSWSFYMYLDQTLERLFDRRGHGDLRAVGARTARSGSKAKHWTAPDYLVRIDEELAANPTIGVVQVTLGGNDFLAGENGGGWYATMTQQDEDALLATVVANLQVVLDHIHQVDPTLEIVVSLYDYPNFVESLTGLGAIFCVDLWEDLDRPTPEEINLAALRFEDAVANALNSRPRTTYVRHLGTQQFRYGYPSLEIAPFTLQPPGDLQIPSPPEAMRYGGADCFHLRKTSYDLLADNLWREFYGPLLDGELSQLDFETSTVWPAQAITD